MPDAKENEDVEKQSNDDHMLEKVKPESSPVINASLVLLYITLASMFITGWVALNSCPLNRMIPIYLIIAGSTGILTKIIMHTRNRHVFNFMIALALFDIAWHIFGSYIVYREYTPNFNPDYGPYCQRTAYLLAFWIITVFYTLAGLFVTLSCCTFLMRNTFVKT